MCKDIRVASRIIPFTIDGNFLLMKGHDIDNPDYNWWFTIGGGQAEGELATECAIRELYEETGINVSKKDLSPIFIFREGKFEFTNKVVYQNESFFLVLLPKMFIPHCSNFTDNEKNVIDELKWWNINDLCYEVNNNDLCLFPRGLDKILADTFAKFNNIGFDCSSMVGCVQENSGADLLNVKKYNIDKCELEKYGLENCDLYEHIQNNFYENNSYNIYKNISRWKINDITNTITRLDE